AGRAHGLARTASQHVVNALAIFVQVLSLHDRKAGKGLGVNILRQHRRGGRRSPVSSLRSRGGHQAKQRSYPSHCIQHAHQNLQPRSISSVGLKRTRTSSELQWFLRCPSVAINGG